MLLHVNNIMQNNVEDTHNYIVTYTYLATVFVIVSIKIVPKGLLIKSALYVYPLPSSIIQRAKTIVRGSMIILKCTRTSFELLLLLILTQ